jgi:hypothetical protein
LRESISGSSKFASDLRSLDFQTLEFLRAIEMRG